MGKAYGLNTQVLLANLQHFCNNNIIILNYYYFIPGLFPSHSWWAESCSVRLSRGWCAAGNLGASRVSMTTGRIQGKFHFIPTSFNSFIHPVIRSYCPSGFRGSFTTSSLYLATVRSHCPSGVRGRNFPPLLYVMPWMKKHQHWYHGKNRKIHLNCF